MVLLVEGNLHTLEIDLIANLQTRNKLSSWYLGRRLPGGTPPQAQVAAMPDNLVRARLIRNWEAAVAPRLRMRLNLGAAGCFLYQVMPHSLFMGGIQLDVQAFLASEPATGQFAADAAIEHQQKDHA
jgi:hypothetical protein